MPATRIQSLDAQLNKAYGEAYRYIEQVPAQV